MPKVVIDQGALQSLYPVPQRRFTLLRCADGLFELRNGAVQFRDRSLEGRELVRSSFCDIDSRID